MIKLFYWARCPVDAGDDYTCAIIDSGDIACWGLNSDGQLGIGSTETVGTAPGHMGAALPRVDLGG